MVDEAVRERLARRDVKVGINVFIPVGIGHKET